MTPARVREIAAEFYMFLAGDNDSIAANPARWGEKLESWSAEEVAGVVAALITKAVNEELENAAIAVEGTFGRAHTYASENADVYRAQDHATHLAAKRVRALKVPLWPALVLWR